MQILCDRCVRALRNKSRGEKIFIGDALDECAAEICNWCERTEADLHPVMFGRRRGGNTERR